MARKLSKTQIKLIEDLYNTSNNGIQLSDFKKRDAAADLAVKYPFYFSYKSLSYDAKKGRFIYLFEVKNNCLAFMPDFLKGRYHPEHETAIKQASDVVAKQLGLK